MKISCSEGTAVGPLPLPSRLNPALPALGVASLLAAGTNAYGVIVYSG
jgi:hypothetical protein